MYSASSYNYPGYGSSSSLGQSPLRRPRNSVQLTPLTSSSEFPTPNTVPRVSEVRRGHNTSSIASSPVHAHWSDDSDSVTMPGSGLAVRRVESTLQYQQERDELFEEFGSGLAIRRVESTLQYQQERDELFEELSLKSSECNTLMKKALDAQEKKSELFEKLYQKEQETSELTQKMASQETVIHSLQDRLKNLEQAFSQMEEDKRKAQSALQEQLARKDKRIKELLERNSLQEGSIRKLATLLGLQVRTLRDDIDMTAL